MSDGWYTNGKARVVDRSGTKRRLLYPHVPMSRSGAGFRGITRVDAEKVCLDNGRRRVCRNKALCHTLGTGVARTQSRFEIERRAHEVADGDEIGGLRRSPCGPRAPDELGCSG